jgi:hypothetical protein
MQKPGSQIGNGPEAELMLRMRMGQLRCQAHEYYVSTIAVSGFQSRRNFGLQYIRGLAPDCFRKQRSSGHSSPAPDARNSLRPTPNLASKTASVQTELRACTQRLPASHPAPHAPSHRTPVSRTAHRCPHMNHVRPAAPAREPRQCPRSSTKRLL